MTTEKKIKKLRQISHEIDELYFKMEIIKAEQKLKEVVIQARDINEAYYLFFQGELAGYINKDLDEQNSLFNQALTLRSDDSFLLSNKGIALTNLGRVDEAIECFNKALSIKPDDFYTIKNKANALLKNEELDEAIEHFDKALAIKPNDIQAQLNKGLTLLRKKQLVEAIECFDKVLTNIPDDNRALNSKGVALTEKGMLDEAIECFDKALAIRPDDDHTLKNKGLALLKIRKLDEAIEYLDKALAIKPDDANALSNKGVALSEKGQFDTAIECFDKALEIKPDDVHALSNKATSLSEKEQFETAIEHFDKALEIEPDDVYTLKNKGLVLLKIGDFDEAIEYLDKALAIKPDDAQALKIKGITLSKKGEHDIAIEYFDKALAIKHDDVQILSNKAATLSEKSLFDEALEYFDKALDIKPDDIHALSNKGVALGNKGQFDEAIKYFDKALTINSNDVPTLTNKAATLSEQGQFDEAIKYLDKALSFKPDDVLTLNTIGATLAKNGQFNKAIKYIDTALEINPKDSNTLSTMGFVLGERKQLDKALKYFDMALAINPYDSHALSNKGVTLSEMGQFDEALECLDKALALNSNNSHALCNKSFVLFEKGEHQLAFDLVSEAKRLSPKSKEINRTYLYIATYLKKRIPEKEQQTLIELKAVVDQTRSKMEGRIDSFRAQMKETEKKRNEFLSTESLIDEDLTFLLTLRKWNSYTPIIPASHEERNVGGGYFIFYEGQGTVIDPGYNFIENFYNAGGRIVDINNIILTHAHDDHTSDFEALLTLLYQFNKKNGLETTDDNYKTVKVYANTGSLIKFSGLLDLRRAKYLDHVITINPGMKFDLSNNLELEILNAYHDELITENYSTGVKFNIGQEKNKSIIITSDTGLFPKTEQKVDGQYVADTTKPEVWETYPQNNISLLIAHVGSIHNNEFDSSLRSHDNKIFYPNHLGVIGTTRIITALKPSLAILSEFGEELSSFQRDLVEIIEKSVCAFFDNSDTYIPKVLPGDLSLIYDINQETIYCVLSEKMVPFGNIKYGLPDPKIKKRFYYYNESSQRVDELSSKGELFEKHRQERRGLYYFKKD